MRRSSPFLNSQRPKQKPGRPEAPYAEKLSDATQRSTRKPKAKEVPMLVKRNPMMDKPSLPTRGKRKSKIEETKFVVPSPIEVPSYPSMIEVDAVHGKVDDIIRRMTEANDYSEWAYKDIDKLQRRITRLTQNVKGNETNGLTPPQKGWMSTLFNALSDDCPETERDSVLLDLRERHEQALKTLSAEMDVEAHRQSEKAHQIDILEEEKETALRRVAQLEEENNNLRSQADSMETDFLQAMESTRMRITEIAATKGIPTEGSKSERCDWQSSFDAIQTKLGQLEGSHRKTFSPARRLNSTERLAVRALPSRFIPLSVKEISPVRYMLIFVP